MIILKSLLVLIIFSLLIIGFDNKILDTPTGNTIEIYQDLSNTLKSNLFDLGESDSHVYITLINQGNRLFVYQNGKK